MTKRVTFPSPIGESSGVVAEPTSTAKAGVVLIHEWWGVNEQIQGTLQKWADAGFLAIVPDLYHGKLAKDATEAGAMMNGLDFGKAVQEIAGAIGYLKAQGCAKVAVTGYCMGGALSFASAVHLRGLAAVVPFYGIPGDLDWTKVDAPVQAHFAKLDKWATVAAGEKIKTFIPHMELHVYDADHAFCNEKRPEVYNADAAVQSWDRAVAFVRAQTA